MPLDARGSGRSSSNEERHTSDPDQDRVGSCDRERERGESPPRPVSAAGLPGAPLVAGDGDRRGGGRDSSRGDGRGRHRNKSEPPPRPSSAAGLGSPLLPAAPPRTIPGKPPTARGHSGDDRAPASGAGVPSVPRGADTEFARPSSLLEDAACLVKDRAASRAAAAAARAADSARSPVAGAAATPDAARLHVIAALWEARILGGAEQHGLHTLCVVTSEWCAATSRAATAPSRYGTGNPPAYHLCV